MEWITVKYVCICASKNPKLVFVGPYVIGNRHTCSSLMMTSSNGNIFHVTGPLCGEFSGHRWIPLTKASDADLWWVFYLRLIKRFSKQSWGRWFETPSRWLWRHCNATFQSSRLVTVGCVCDLEYLIHHFVQYIGLYVISGTFFFWR